MNCEKNDGRCGNRPAPHLSLIHIYGVDVAEERVDERQELHLQIGALPDLAVEIELADVVGLALSLIHI